MKWDLRLPARSHYPIPSRKDTKTYRYFSPDVFVFGVELDVVVVPLNHLDRMKHIQTVVSPPLDIFKVNYLALFLLKKSA